jgi:hypothetical protein
MPPRTSAHALVAIFLAGCTTASVDAPVRVETHAAAATGPIVVELFTSQGCSSCPPADRTVSNLASSGIIGDRPVVPLAFHVDYWNDLGWADPFSLEAWSDRQHRYAEVLTTRRVYTPQLVVAGREHVVGSNTAEVTAMIDAAPIPSRLEATIAWHPTTATITATAPTGADAFVAVYEDAITTAIPRGENAGQTVRNDHVVRRFARVAAAGRTGTVEVTLDPSWNKLGAVVIAQGADMAIVGSRALPSR